MVTIPLARNTDDDTVFLFSPPVNRKFIPLYGRAIIFKNYGWQFENQKEPSHITMEYISHQGHSPTNGTTNDAKLLSISTPGPTPLRTHMAFSSTAHVSVDTTDTTLPSLLPATGTTLVLPPSPMSPAVQYTTTGPPLTTVSSKPESPTAYDSPPSSSPFIQTITTKPKYQLHLPVPAIAAISAAGFFGGIVFLLWFFWLRTPRRRRLPTPSLPKLENGDIEENSPPESPLFGPKERFSQRAELHPHWSWVTYPQNKSVQECKPQGDDSTSRNFNSRSTSAPRLPDVAVTSRRKSSSIYSASGHFSSLSAPVSSPRLSAGHPSLQQVQAAITRATNRMSTLSFTCASKYPNENGKDSGLAFTADGHDMMKRRSRILRNNSVYEGRRRSSRLPAGLAYDGADVTSPIPTMEFMPLDSPDSEEGYDIAKAERRTRIQTPYYIPSSYPRISSTMPTTYGVATRVKLCNRTSTSGFASLKTKSETQRAKETQALTYALGLASPAVRESIPSPQPTLGPDDSLSVVESKRSLKRRSKRGSTYLGDDSRSHQDIDGRRQHLVTTSARSVVAVVSGSLVSAEDIKAQSSGFVNNVTGLTANLTGPTLVNKSMGTKSTLVPSKVESRAGDKPPRVPSPPPLPSLAQMALEQHNPDAYADYRSPTYSIYNLYDDNRRSTVYGGKR